MVCLKQTDKCDLCRRGKHAECEARGRREVVGSQRGYIGGGSITRCMCGHKAHFEARQKQFEKWLKSLPPMDRCITCGTKRNLVKNLNYNCGRICEACWKEASDRIGPIGKKGL